MWNISAITILSAAFISAAPVLTPEQAYFYDIPEEIQVACEKYGAEYDICPEELEAFCYEESRYIANVSNGNCKGLMQVNEKVHKARMEKLGITDIYDVDSNIHLAADLLAELYADYSSDTGTVIMLYHGESNAIKRGKQGNYSNYAKRVMQDKENLLTEHGK